MQIYIYALRRLRIIWARKVIQTPDEIVFWHTTTSTKLKNKIELHTRHIHCHTHQSTDVAIEGECRVYAPRTTHIWSVWRVRCGNETMEPNRRIERQLNVSANNLNMEIYRHRCKRQPRQRWRNVTFQLEPLALCVKQQRRTRKKKKQKNRSEHNIIWINEKYLACETVYLCSNGVPFALSFSVSHIWPSMNWEKCVYEHVR